MASGLIKIILINSFIKKKGIYEIEVDQHCQLIGTNAQGKTTISKLIPIFQGLSSGSIVKKTSTNKSFSEYYLPSTNSYIIFEYITHNGTTVHVSLTAKGESSGVNYRFIDKEFIKDDYITFAEEVHTVLEPEEVKRVFLSSNITTSNFLQQNEYARIIQNKQDRDSNKRNIKSLKQFSLMPGREELRHIDEINKTLIQGGFKFDNVKKCISDLMVQDTGQNSGFELDIDPSGIKELVDNMSAVSSILRKSDVFEKAFENLNSLKHTLAQKQEMLTQMQIHLKDIDKKIETSKNDFDNSKKTKKQIEDEWDSNQKYFIENESNLNVAIETLTKMIAQIEKTNQSYIDEGIAKKEQDVENLNSFKSDLDQLKSQFDEFSSKGDGINKKYEILLQKQESINNKEKIELQRKVIKITKSHDIHMAKLQKEYYQNKEAESNLNQKDKDILVAAKINLENDINNIDRNLLNIFPNLGLVTDKNNLTENLNDVDSDITDQYQSKGFLSDEKSFLDKELSCENRKLEKLKDQQLKLEINLNDLEVLRSPIKGSLRDFLSINMSEYPNVIHNKIIRPEILDRKDLNPKLLNSDNTIYGLQIDDLLIDDMEVESDETLKIVLADIATNESDKKLLSTRISVINKRLSELSLDINEVNQLIQSLGEKKETILLAIDINIESIDEYIVIEKDKLKNQKESTEKSLAKTNRSIVKNKKELTEKIKTLTDLFDDIKNKEQSKIAILVTNNESRVIELDTSYKELEDKISIQKSTELKDNGIDDKIHEILTSEINDLELKIKSTTSYSNEVTDYKNFIKRDYSELNDKKLDLLNKNNRLSSLLTQQQEEKNIKDRHLEEIIKLINVRKALFDKHTDCKIDFKTALSASCFNQEKDCVRTISKEISEMAIFSLNKIFKTVFDKENSKNSHLNNDIKEIGRILNTHTNSIVYKSWTESTQEIDSTGESNDKRNFDKMSKAESIYKDILPDLKTTIVQELIAKGKRVVSFHKQLEEIDYQIKTFGRKLSKSVNQNLDFDFVSNIEIEFKSIITTREYWANLNVFKDLFKKWETKGFDSDFGDNLLDAIMDIAATSGKEGISENIESLFDLKISLIENGDKKIVSKDSDMDRVSSNGGGFIIKLVIFSGLIRLYKKSDNVLIHMPLDELDKLHSKNINKVVDSLNQMGVIIIGALPEPKSQDIFKKIYQIDIKNGISTNVRKQSKLEMALNQKIKKEA
jgi:hypothetical protein